MKRAASAKPKVWTEIPPGVFYIVDLSAHRVIYVARVTDSEYGAVKSHFCHVPSLHHAIVTRMQSERLPLRTTISAALRDLWSWAKDKQSAKFLIIEGEVAS